jgi:hypothetical protein
MRSLRPSFALAFFVAFSAPRFAQDAEATFHRAYFLEHEGGKLEEALELYRRVESSPGAGAELKKSAADHAAGLREDLASQDLARLMPPETVLFAECAQPGAALERLLGGLGLLGTLEESAAHHGFALSPELVRGLVGLRGVAVGLTHLPLEGGAPQGVLVLNPGSLAPLRGLIEAAVQAQGTPVETIEGVPTWSFEGAYVSLGKRLVVAASAREELAGVWRRLSGSESISLANHPVLGARLAQRGGAPFFCCLNAAPVRPALAALLAREASRDPRAALAATALDVAHFEGFVARVDVGEDGCGLSAELLLAPDHQNLVLNLMRGATLDPVLLERIPSGVAAFLGGALNERGPGLAPLNANSKGAPVVTAADFARELFANLAGFAVFVLPGGAPLPNVALVLTSNDPARTQAVLGMVLGLASSLTGGSLDGKADEIGGAPTRVYTLPPGIPLYLTTHENTLLLSPSEELIEQALEGRTSAQSVLHDEAFAAELGRLDKDTTFVASAHLGRLLEVARPFLPGDARAELERFATLAARSVVTLRTKHGDTSLGIALALHGLPRIDGLVAEALAAQRGPRVAEASSGLEQKVEAHPGLQQHFDELAKRADGGAAARAFARQQLPLIADDPRALNNFAWELLTEERYAQRFDDLAKEFAQAANEKSAQSVWQYLDTLALACFRTGAVAEAIALEEHALRQVGASDRPAVEASLLRYRGGATALAGKAQ